MYRGQHVAFLGAIYLATVWFAPAIRDAEVQAASTLASPHVAPTAQVRTFEQQVVDTVVRAFGNEGQHAGWRGGIPSWVPIGQPSGRVPTPAPLPPAVARASVTPVEVSESPGRGCTFVQGFATLRQVIGPEVVGDCIENERAAVNGDVVQRTTLGELVWRKADNTPAFTNGHETWLSGPLGLQKRFNSECFAWEPARTSSADTSAPGDVRPGAVLPAKRIVSYYGNPLTAAMGILGEPPVETMLNRLQREADAYATASGCTKPVQPALELVATVAQAGAGPDGLYVARMSPALIEQVAGWAESRGHLLILDVQVGRSSVEAEVGALLPYLERPNVHLALDPEFAMRADQVPGQEIGSLDAQAVNWTIHTLAELVDRRGLPPKVLLVHRFTENMLTNADSIERDPRVQVVTVMDGFGGPAAKRASYQAYIRNQPVEFAGFKLFYEQDSPVLSPSEVLELDPPPLVVIYQ